MSAERLREAAKVLRERANGENPWPCLDYIQRGVRHLVRNCDIECDHSTWNESSEAYEEQECPAPFGAWDRYSTAAYIATMHPGVGLALADWLDDEAKSFEHPQKCDDERGCCNNCEYDASVLHALAVAGTILGGAS